MTCQCFKCLKGYESENPDDIAGDGRCPDCAKEAARIALKVDLEMANKRAANPIPKSRIRELFTEEEILKGEVAGTRRINIKDLGITPLG